MVGRQQHEFPAAVPGYLYRLAQRPVLKLADFALELHCGRLRHEDQNGFLEYTYYPLSGKGAANEIINRR
jgi:hypothetical protein